MGGNGGEGHRQQDLRDKRPMKKMIKYRWAGRERVGRGLLM